MKTVPLNETAIVKLSAAGAGTAKVGPLSSRERWHPQNVTVSATGTVESGCKVYVGDVNSLKLRDTSVSATSGDNTDRCNADVVKCGEFIWAVWSGASANAVATLTVTGTKDI